VGAAAVRDAESKSPEANITGFPEALWWSLVTITTVGYGDFFPVTTQGRFVAAVLMITGIAALGSLTGAVATKLLAGQKSSQSDEIADLKAALAAKEEASK
jgi:voltage-gated potassium channel